MDEKKLITLSNLCKRENKCVVVKIISKGFSMYPTIKPGNILDIQVGSIYYHVGDIIVFLYKKKLCTHRIELICNDKLVCRGDHNNTFMIELITIDNVLGKVTRINDL